MGETPKAADSGYADVEAMPLMALPGTVIDLSRTAGLRVRPSRPVQLGWGT